jgi:hypothetical protein
MIGAQAVPSGSALSAICNGGHASLSTTYMPELWHDFFLMVGGSAAALTGLVFVALSINPRTIGNDATHRYRAIGTLNGYMVAFGICAFGLIQGQNGQVMGLGWIAAAIYALIVYDYGFNRAQEVGRSNVELKSSRVLIGNALYVAQIAGATMLVLGVADGVAVASVAMIVTLAFTTSGAWLLLMGVDRPPAVEPEVTLREP